MIAKSFIILTVVGVCWCAMSMEFPPQKPKKLAHKEGCYIREINDVIPFGKTITPVGYCYSISCSDMITYASCGAAMASKPCYMTKENPTVPYPDCCPQIKCP